MDYEWLKNIGFDGIFKLYEEGNTDYRGYLDSILSLSKYKIYIIDTQKKGIENAINIIDTLKEDIKDALDIINTLKKAINIINTLKKAIEKAIKEAIEEAIALDPETSKFDIETKILMLYVIDNNEIPSGIDDKYGRNIKYVKNDDKDDYDVPFEEKKKKKEEKEKKEREERKNYLNELRETPYYLKLKEDVEEAQRKRVEEEERKREEEKSGGSRRNKATPKSNAKPKAKPKHEDMTMKDIKELCKVNQIKLSKVVEGERVVYKKKELITKLKRKKLL